MVRQGLARNVWQRPDTEPPEGTGLVHQRNSWMDRSSGTLLLDKPSEGHDCRSEGRDVQ